MALPQVTLNDGHTIPVIGFGTGTAWFKATGPDGISRPLVDSITTAIKTGYHHIDSAEMYENEPSTGLALKECGIDRDQLFITTKVFAGINDIQTSLQNQLKALGVSSVNLYLLHSPLFPSKPGYPTLSEAWATMEYIQAQGLAQSIGVSNYRIQDLEAMLKTATVKPAVNQIELHPYVWAEAEPLIEFHKKHGIKTEVYGPLSPLIRSAGGPLDAVASAIGKRHNLTEGQVLLKWALAKADVILTTSSKESRMKEQLSVVNGVAPLTPTDIEQLDAAGKQGGIKRCFMPHMSE